MNKKIILPVILCAAMLLVPYGIARASAPVQEKEPSFREILDEYEISISGHDNTMTRFELHGMIRDINDRAVAEKYEKSFYQRKMS